MTEVNYHELSNRWWVQAATPTLNKRTRNKPIIDAIFTVADLIGHPTDGLKDYLKQLSPRKSKTDPESIAFYDNSYKYENERLTKTSPGRFIKRLFPSAPDKVVDGFSLWWSGNVAFDKSDYKLVIGNTREDFKQAFTNYRRTKGLYYQGYRKSISDSCMRHKFDRLPCHPSEVYASGDFEVVTVKDNRGKTRARCVSRVKLLDGSSCHVHGFIYASDNHSASMIETYLSSKGSSVVGIDGWDGAKLLRVAATTENYLCPYVDRNRYVTGYDSDFLVFCRPGELDCSYSSNTTSGMVCLPDDPAYNYNYKAQ